MQTLDNVTSEKLSYFLHLSQRFPECFLCVLMFVDIFHSCVESLRIFGVARMSSVASGCVWTRSDRSDGSGCVRALSDVFGRVRIYSDAFGCVQMCSDVFEHFQNLFQDFRSCSAVYTFFDKLLL